MVEIAHASTAEKAKLQMKRVQQLKRERRAKEQAIKADIGEEEYNKNKAEANKKTLKEKAALAIWDYEHQQYPVARYAALRDLLESRKAEIIEETPEKIKIEGIINELKFK